MESKVGWRWVFFLVGLVLVAFACSDATNKTLSPTGTPGRTITPVASTPRPTSTPTNTPVPVGGTTGWPAYSDPDGVFRFRYPPGWLLRTAGQGSPPGIVAIGLQNIVLYNFDNLAQPPSHEFPPNSIKIDIYFGPVDDETAEQTCKRTEEPVAFSLGGVAGWQYEYESDEPGIDHIRIVAADRNNYRLCFVALFFGDDATKLTVDQILGSVAFVS